MRSWWVWSICVDLWRISAHQIHRIGEAIRPATSTPMGGEGRVIEADETYIGKLPAYQAPKRKFENSPRFGPHHKHTVLLLVERGGQACLFYVGKASVETVTTVVSDIADRASSLHADRVATSFVRRRNRSSSA